MGAQHANVAPQQARRPSLWRNRDFLLLWSGQGVSSLGTEITLVAFPLLVLALTHSPAQAGFVGAMRSVPFVLIALPAGALIDRWDRKRVMLLCDAGRAIALGSIPLAFALGHFSLAQLYVVALAEGTFFAFFNLANSAALPHVVTKEQVPEAIARSYAIESIAMLVGPFLGTALFTIGRALPFLGDAISYAASVVSLRLIRAQFQMEREATAPVRLREQIMEGLRWLWRQPLIRYMAFLTAGVNFCFASQTLIVIVLAQGMHASATTIGIVFAIGGAGGIVGSLVAPRIRQRLSFGQAIIGLCWLWALLWPMMILAPTPLALGGVLLAISLSSPTYDVVQYSYRLALIPDHLLGRVNSAFRVLLFGTQPVGLALGGVLLQRFNGVVTVLVFTVTMAVLALITTANIHVRAAQPLDALRSA